MNIEFDSMSTNKFFKWMASKFIEVSMPEIKEAVHSTYSDDELLTRKEVSKRILKCDEKTAAEHFLYQKGFPYVDFGKSSRRYPKRAVEKWIEENTKFN